MTDSNRNWPGGVSLGNIAGPEPHECNPAMNPDTGLYDGNHAPEGDVRQCIDCGALWVKDELVRSARGSSYDFVWYRQVTKRRERKRILKLLQEP